MSKIYYETPSGDSREVESLEQGKAEILVEHPNAVFGDEWEVCGNEHERLLVWQDESAYLSDAWNSAMGQFVRDAKAAIKPGDRVQGGEGDDHDTGIVDSIDGDNMATVRWDTLVVSQVPIELLERR